MVNETVTWMTILSLAAAFAPYSGFTRLFLQGLINWDQWMAGPHASGHEAEPLG